MKFETKTVQVRLYDSQIKVLEKYDEPIEQLIIRAIEFRCRRPMTQITLNHAGKQKGVQVTLPAKLAEALDLLREDPESAVDAWLTCHRPPAPSPDKTDEETL